MTLALDLAIINPELPKNDMEDQTKPQEVSAFEWTNEAFQQLPDDGHHYEIINGKLVDRGNSGALHGYVCSTLMILLGGYIRDKRLGQFSILVPLFKWPVAISDRRIWRFSPRKDYREFLY